MTVTLLLYGISAMRVEIDDLIDANDVARLLGLAHRNTVSQYLKNYPNMPRPVIDLGPKRPRLWLRPEVEAWLVRRGPVRRGRPAKDLPASPDNNHPPAGGVGVSRGGGGKRAAGKSASPARPTS